MNDYPLNVSTLTKFLGKLPIGISLGNEGVRLNSFRLHDYTTEHDLYLLSFYGDAEEERELDFLQMCCSFLPLIIDTIDGYPIKDLALKLNTTPGRLIRNMYACDILCILLNIRAANGGLDIAFGDICPVCGTKNQDKPELGLCHSLEGVEITYVKNECQHLNVALEESISYQGSMLDSILLRPMLFEQFAMMMSDNPSSLQIDVNHLLSQGATLEHFRGIRSLRDRNTLIKASKHLSRLGPEMEIAVDMKCRSCSHEWESWLGYDSMLQFYRDLLKPPSRNYLDDVVFFLTFGEQAPCKSIEEAKKIPVRQRDAIVKRLSEAYEKQKKDMEDSSRKSRGKGTTTKQTY